MDDFSVLFRTEGRNRDIFSAMGRTERRNRDIFSAMGRTERRNRDIFSAMARTERRNMAGTSVRRNGRYLGQSSSQNLGGADYISCLPESVLLHILSFLDMKDAVKTGILSSKWKSLWTFTPNLIFNREEIQRVSFLDIDSKRLMDFVDFLDRTLSLYQRESIHKFQLCLPYSEKYVSRFMEWILFATERNVEELILESIAYKRFDFYWSPPPWLFENQLLRVLELRSLEIYLPGQVRLSSLKTLSLSELQLNNSIVNRLMAGCPLIEDFRLLYCAFDDCICISSPTLQRVSLRLIDDDNLLVTTHNSQGFEVDAPNLLSFNVSSCMCKNKYRLKNCFSIQETYINLFATRRCRGYSDNIGHQCLLQFMKDLSPAKVLRLSKSTVQVLSTVGMEYLPAPINGCKCLKFTTGLAEVELSLIGKLLTSSPDLDTLMIDVNHYRDHNIARLVFPPVHEVSDETSLKDFYCRCLEGVDHVKTVIISGLLRRNGIEKVDSNQSLLRGWLKSELYLVKFLLQNAKVLEELTIRITDEKYFKMLQSSNIETHILALPRASPNARVSILTFFRPSNR